ncbi:FKBP-type peptidyl-prolyl cis-trans isomerase [Sphingomonas sp.]|uniref:FKBP-type peptidyl-prolyl cis-trans isomerase n=1 Tax=Sphingomonas sp. TaxID=28214 RepID=UPI00325F954A
MTTITQVPIQPLKRGSVTKLWLGIALLVAAAVLLAWAGAGRIVGVRVKTVEAGKGAVIGINDGVIIDLEGRLPNGTVFETTKGRGPAPILVAQTIPGFSRALQQMQPGGRYTVHIPAKLAYGATPPPGSPIPTDSDLDFDIHVLQVVPNAALMAGRSGPGPGGPQPR